MLSLSNLKPNKGATKKRKRVGRGNASGHGTYSTRGLKGQKSRSGVSGLKRLGMKPMLLNLPKKRGFTSLQDKDQVVNLTAINRHFKEGGKVTPNTLLKAGLIENASKSVKILGQGQLSLKNLELVNLKVSATAKAQLEKLGGKVITK